MNRFRLLILWCLVGFATVSATAAELRDVSLKCKGPDCFLLFQFDPAGGLPSYYQKFDGARRVLKIAFSTTNIKIPAGSWVMQADASGIKSVNLKTETTARGVPLLVFEWNVGPDISSDKNPVLLEDGGRFKMKFTSKSNPKPWSLSAISKAAVQSAKVKKPEPKKVEEKKPEEKKPEAKKVEAKPIVPEKSSVVVAPVPLPEVKTDAPSTKGVALPPGLEEVSWIRGYGQEQLVIRFEGDAPAILRQTDSMLVFPLPKALKIQPPIVAFGSSLVRDIRLVKASLSGLELVVRLKGVPVQMIRRGSRFCLQASVTTPPGIDSWTVLATGAKHQVFNVSSSDDEMESLDQFAQGFVKASSPAIQTFKLKKGTRDLIVVEEAVILRDSPSETGKQLRQLKFGDRLVNMEQAKLYFKVKSGEVTGYVNRRMVAYQDELSHLQSEKLQQLSLAQKESQKAALASGATPAGDSLDVTFDEPDQDRITYSSFGRRDPFVELKGVVNEGINIDGVELVGIIWEAEIPMVLLTDTRNPGVSYTLKEGDSILNGKVLKITQDEVLFLINEFGISRRYTMSLPDKYGGKK